MTVSRRYFRRADICSCVVLLLAMTFGCAPGADSPDAEALPSAQAAPEASYVDDGTCAGCHASQVADWTGSHHDLAMQVATTESVLGDFGPNSGGDSEGNVLTHFGVTTRFFTENGRFMVSTEGADGEVGDFEVRYTFGVEPLQQYLVEFQGGRLQVLSVAWDTGGQEWFHLYPDERIAPDDPLHWTGPLQNWNFMCAECHSTNVRKNFDLSTDSYDTGWDALDVGCQGCHGPGSAHLEWAAEGASVPSAEPNGLLVGFAGDEPRFQVESCAACHSLRRRISTDHRVGQPFMDQFLPETLARDDLYHADGQILGEVYVYGSFLQSRMYHEGVRCTDCHNPHSLNLWVSGNALCEQCHHVDAPVNRFPVLESRNYDTPEHHFHPVDSAGAACVNCHMPERTYMIVDPRRDHSFRIPRPDLSVRLGTPNACNDCHTDQTAAWAAAAIDEWYGDRLRDRHYGEILAAGRRGDPDAATLLANLAMDQSKPAIVRATVLDLILAYGNEGREALIDGLGDPDPLVRTSAVRGLEQFNIQDRVFLLRPLLLDPVRAVRLEAARVLAPATGMLDPTANTALARGLAEYEQVQESLADTAAAHLNLGVVHAATGNPVRALDDYRTALGRDPTFVPASINLATLLNQLGRNAEATAVLTDAIERSPETGELHYSLGLVRAELDELPLAAESLGRAADLLPQRPRVRYNYALALQQLGRRGEAEEQLLESFRGGPDDASVVEALAIFYVQDEDWDEALEWSELLVEMLPADPEARQFRDRIREDSTR